MSGPCIFQSHGQRTITPSPFWVECISRGARTASRLRHCPLISLPGISTNYKRRTKTGCLVELLSRAWNCNSNYNAAYGTRVGHPSGSPSPHRCGIGSCPSVTVLRLAVFRVGAIPSVHRSVIIVPESTLLAISQSCSKDISSHTTSRLSPRLNV